MALFGQKVKKNLQKACLCDICTIIQIQYDIEEVCMAHNPVWVSRVPRTSTWV